MNISSEEFKRELSAFQRNCRDNLARGNKLFEILDHGEHKDLVHQPLLLKIILERYLELVGSRLIPALEKNANFLQTPRPQAGVQEDSSDFTFSREAEVGIGSEVGRDQGYRASGSWQTGTSQSSREAPGTVTSRTVDAAPPEAGHGGVETDATGKHRRTVPRYKRRLPLQYKILGRDLSPHKAYSRDIGAMGLFIMSNRPEKTGDHIRLEIEVPGYGPTQLEATVVWTKYVPHNLRSMDYSGFGVRISKASEIWYNFFVAQEEAL